MRAKGHRLNIILKAIGLPRRTYYHWRNYQPSKREIENQSLIQNIKQIWCDNFKVYGYPRINLALRQQGIMISNGRVYRLMRQAHIHSLMTRRFRKPSTHVDYAQRPNLVKNINHKTCIIWRADITYLELRLGIWVYLSSIYDEQTKHIISAIIDRNMTSELVVRTLRDALNKTHQHPQYLHSDMGSQYTSFSFEKLLADNHIKHSYSKQGYPYDNSPIEAFHSLLKREFVYQTHFTSYEDLVLRTEKYIQWYNNQRLHF